MSDNLVFIFKYENKDGSVQSVLHVDHYDSDLDWDTFNKTYNHPYMGNCSKYQIDAVNKESVYKQFPGNEAYAEKEWQDWQKLASDGQGAIPDHSLAGTYLNMTVQGVSAECVKLDDFKPTPGDGSSPAVPLDTAILTASTEPPKPTDPVTLPTPAPPVATSSTALVALSTTSPQLAITGKDTAGMEQLGGLLLAGGVLFCWLARRFKRATA